jgi:RNA-directed DNA polymerase
MGVVPTGRGAGGPLGEGDCRKPEMHERRKSDRPVVPSSPPNKPGSPGAEAVEGRGLAKGNTASKTRPGHCAGEGVSSALDRVRRAARKDKEVRFTALLHHVTVDRLRSAYEALRRDAAAGVDGVSWQDYGQDLEVNLRDLHARVQRGGYRARPSRRVYIPKADGRRRPLGVAAVEDKVLQRAVVEVLNAIYEADFRGFSYGFRPGRSPHDALDALAVAIERKKVNWILDADIHDFFGSLDFGWLEKFLEHRIADRRMLRLIGKWLKAGVIEDGEWSETVQGTAQGASVSPLLANVYLHYVFDLWADRWRRLHARGDVILVRFADDYIAGFQHRDDADRFLADLRDRLAKFSLELATEKTRLIEFGRYAVRDRSTRGLGRPETLGRAEARCRRYRRSVSSTRPPNRTCPFLSIRLSTGHAVADRGAEFMRRWSPAGWWPVLLRRSPPTARGSGGRDSGIGSPAPRRATRASCLRGWSSCAPNIVA